jgi:lipoprotein-anchoring transpeptidase ErfK/SrfK
MRYLCAVAALLAFVFAPVMPAGADFDDDGFFSEQLDMPLDGDYSPLRRRIVAFSGDLGPGTIIVATDERRLYYVLGDGTAIRYGIGVGRAGFEWSGESVVSRKAEWPGWTPPAEMRRRQPELPAHMPGGPGNPMGARALYLGASLYRIHGTNNGRSIGRAWSSGCIRMMNEDVIDLYERVRVGARVIVR